MKLSKIIDFEDFETLRKSFDENSIKSILPDITKKSLSSFEIIKITLQLLFPIADLNNEYGNQSNLKFFKEASSIILTNMIKPLIQDVFVKNDNLRIDDEVNELKVCNLSKFWCTYLCIIDIILKAKINHKNWIGSTNDWFTREEFELLEETLKILEKHLHWKILLLQAICRRESLLAELFKASKNQEFFELIKQYYRNIIDAEFIKIKNNEKGSNFNIRRDLLEQLVNIMKSSILNIKDHQNDDVTLKESIIFGRFEKNIYKNLSHSVIIGDDGGFYALMNSITSEEKKMINIDESFSQIWQEPDEKNKYKVVIGQSSLIKIRLGMILIKNKKSKKSIKVGDFVCVKKTSHFLELVEAINEMTERTFNFNEILINSWNSYLSMDIDIGNIIFSQGVFDMRIIENSSSIKVTHQKGYIIQPFQMLYDGSKVFEKKQKYHNQSFHQKSYLVSIFDVILQLLNHGICMTDLKPQNTLYDGENNRTMLIDFSGVVRKETRKDLEECKIKHIQEVSSMFAAPELKNAFKKNDPNIKVNLCKCMSYSLGLIIKEIGFKFMNEKNLDLLKLMDCLTVKDPNMRISVEEGLSLLKKIGGESDDLLKQEVNFQPFMKALLKETKSNYAKFGLNPNIESISEIYINLMGHLERSNLVQLFDLSENLDEFIYEKKVIKDIVDESNNNIIDVVIEDFAVESNKITDGLKSTTNQEQPKVLVLLGSSGSGKTTILQKKYLEVLQIWQPDDPIPFYMNLANEDNLRARWEWLNMELKTNLSFTLFSGYRKCKIILFIDSFDEVSNKINYIFRFIEDLGKNKEAKILICCKSEFIQYDKDLLKWFGNDLHTSDLASSFTRRYIAPLKSTQFDFEGYLKNFYLEKINDEEKIQQISLTIKEKKLTDIMTTSFLTHITLKVFPEIMDDQINININQRMIYERYTRQKMENLEFKEILNKKLNITNLTHIVSFFEEKAMILARILFLNCSNRIVFSDENRVIPSPFFEKLEYQTSITYMENSLLAGIITGLDLTFEIRGSVPHEKIKFGFSHEIIKNYYLSKLIVEQTANINIDNNDEKNDKFILGHYLIVDDHLLIKYLAELMKENNEFKNNLNKILLKSRIKDKIKSNDKKIINAAANAISILVAGNVSFSFRDLSSIRINGANIRDGAFSKCDFSNSDLTNVILENCKIDHSLFHKTDMTNAKLSKSLEINAMSPIMCVIISPDGKLIISGCSDLLIKVWEISTGNLLKTLEGHQDIVNSVAISNDNILIASGSSDNTVKLWETLTGNLLKTFESHQNPICSVAFSPDAKVIISSSWDKTIKLWDKLTAKLVKTLTGHKSCVNSVTFSPDGKFIASGSFDFTIKLWDHLTGNMIKSFEDHKDFVRSVVFSPDGTLIMSGSEDKTIKLWDKSTGELIKTFYDFDPILSVAFSPDGTLILSGSVNKTIRLWEKSSKYLIKTFRSHQNSVNSVAFSPDGRMIVSGSSDNTIKLREDSARNLLKLYEGHKGNVNVVLFSPDGKMILSSSSYDDTLKLWNKETSNLIKTFESQTGLSNSLAFSPNGANIVTGSEDKLIKLWEISTGNLLKTFEGHEDAVKSVSFSPNGTLIASGSFDNTLKLWEISSGNLLRTFIGHESVVYSVAFSPDGKLLSSGSNDKTIKLWEKTTGNLLKTYEGHQNEVYSVVFSPNGKLILSGSSDKTVKLWDISTGNLLKTFEGHQNNVRSVAFSPDETLIVSSSDDKTINIWQKSTGNLLNTLEGHDSSVSSVAFSPDGEFVVSGSDDNTVKLWEKIKILETQQNSITNFNFFCKYTISSYKTQFFCKNTIIDNSIISEKNEKILKQRGAIFLKKEEVYPSGILNFPTFIEKPKESNSHFVGINEDKYQSYKINGSSKDKKSCKCLLI